MAVKNHSSKVDVLIVGAGPSGLMLALWMSRLGIKTRVVDKHGAKVSSGHADGLQLRSVELFDSFGVAHRLIQKAARAPVVNSWALNEKGELHRSDRTFFGADNDSSPFNAAYTLHQGNIERILIDAITDHSDIKVERATLPTSFSLNKSQAEDADAYPITVELKHLQDDELEQRLSNSHILTEDGMVPVDCRFESILGRAGQDDVAYNFKGPGGVTETVHAKYMVGCDGAHSWTRRQLGFEMEGEHKDLAWGVMDVIPITDFPDIHMFTTIQSKTGSLIFVPRENNLIRMYVQLGFMKRDAKSPFKVTPEDILAKVQKIIAPFTFRYTYCDWWTVYQVGQRVGNHYSASERVFLAGDAVHTHTPKGGQGMNVSMADAFNLGWKLGGVINGQLSRDVLKTYEAERRPIAQRLIAWDKEVGRVYAGMSEEVVHQTYIQNYEFLSGVGITYKPSVLVAQGGLGVQDVSLELNGTAVNGTATNGAGTALVAKQHLAPGAVLGKRLASREFRRQADWRIMRVQSMLPSDGRWRLIAFGGDALNQTQADRLFNLGESLAAPKGLLKRYKPSPNGLYPIDLLLLHSANERQVELSHFHSTFFPLREDGGYDHTRLYLDASGAGHAFYGVDAAKGCLVVLRPDQHVGYIGELEDLEDVTRYLDNILALRT